jgi:hypothetical protein
MNVKWKLAPDGKGGWVGMIDVPWHPGSVNGGGGVQMLAKGDTKANALGKAAVLAKKVMDNPIAAALMPPGAGLAVSAISALSKSAAAGKLAKTAAKFAGPAMGRLAKVLSF